MKQRTIWKLEKFSHELNEIRGLLPIHENGETMEQFKMRLLYQEIKKMIDEAIEVRKNRKLS